MNNNLFGSLNGFINGNMFNDIYDQYKNYKPLMINPGNDKEQCLFDLDQIQFAMHDISLYLDIFPNDSKMINIFNMYKDKYNSLLIEYQNKYGPLEINYSASNNYFDWVKSPWPWEGV